MNGKAHLVEALRWSTDTEVRLIDAVIASVGMAGPVLLATAAGHPSLGLAASLGSLMIGAVGTTSSLRTQVKELAWVLTPAALASVAATLLAGQGWQTDAGVMALACLAAAIGGYSRPLAVATTRFILFLIMVSHAVAVTSHPVDLLALIATGALWTTMLNLLLGTVERVRRRTDLAGSTYAPLTTAGTPPTATRRFNRWRESLTRLSGWQYTLRLALCLGAAWWLRALWPHHHFYWIALTVAILIRRQIEVLPIQATQRAIGTACGVLAASLFLAHRPSGFGLALAIALLSAARPLLKVRNYLAYSTVMTPLVILILGSIEPLDGGVVRDRLAATVLGVALVVATNFGLRRLATPQLSPGR